MQLLWGTLFEEDKKGEVPCLFSWIRAQPPLVAPIWWTKLEAKLAWEPEDNVACKGQNLLPYEAEKNWSKYGPKTGKSGLVLYPWCVLTAVKWKESLGSDLWGAKIFFPYFLKNERKKITLSFSTYTLYIIFSTLLKNWKDHLLRHEENCALLQELPNNDFFFWHTASCGCLMHSA